MSNDECFPKKRLHVGDTIRYKDLMDGTKYRVAVVTSIEKIKGTENFHATLSTRDRINFGEYDDDPFVVQTIALHKQWSPKANAYVDVAKPSFCKTNTHFSLVAKTPKGYKKEKKKDLLKDVVDEFDNLSDEERKEMAGSESSSSLSEADDVVLHDDTDSENEYERILATSKQALDNLRSGTKHPFWKPVYEYKKSKRTVCKKHKKRLAKSMRKG